MNLYALKPPRRPDPRDDLSALLLRVSGRIRRSTYVWMMGPATVCWYGGWAIAPWVPGETAWLPVVVSWSLASVGAWLAVVASAKRAHDVGWTGWISLGLAFPVARWGFILGLAVAPTEATWNRHGWPPAAVVRSGRR